MGWIADHAALAAWVQAVGVITALATAVGVPWWERRRQRRDALEARRARYRAVAETVAAALAPAFSGAMVPYALDEPLRVLRSLALDGLPHEAAVALVEMRAQLREARLRMKLTTPATDYSVTRAMHSGVLDTGSLRAAFAGLQRALAYDNG